MPTLAEFLAEGSQSEFDRSRMAMTMVRHLEHFMETHPVAPNAQSVTVNSRQLSKHYPDIDFFIFSPAKQERKDGYIVLGSAKFPAPRLMGLVQGRPTIKLPWLVDGKYTVQDFGSALGIHTLVHELIHAFEMADLGYKRHVKLLRHGKKREYARLDKMKADAKALDTAAREKKLSPDEYKAAAKKLLDDGSADMARIYRVDYHKSPHERRAHQGALISYIHWHLSRLTEKGRRSFYKKYSTPNKLLAWAINHHQLYGHWTGTNNEGRKKIMRRLYDYMQMQWNKPFRDYEQFKHQPSLYYRLTRRAA